MSTNKKLAFILPRYGASIIGGAETLARKLAIELAAQDYTIEIFTTCALDNRSWENALEPGAESEKVVSHDGKEATIVVHRFKVDDRNLDRWIPLQISLSEGMRLPIEDQLAWMEDSVSSSALYCAIEQRKESFDAFIFAPYLLGTTFWGSLIAPEKSILIPCLHDEFNAYQDVIVSMARQVAGMMFNAAAEMRLAHSLYGPLKGGVVGMGFVEPEHVSHKPYFKDTQNYIMYLGRKETGKNAHLLVDYFIAGKESNKLPEDLRLVIVGGGDFSDLHRPEALLRDDIIDLHGVSEEEKQQLVKNAQMLVQPSVNESFSIVLMEAWQLETPVLVHADCAVTVEHVKESGGGLYFADQDEFIETVRAVVMNDELRASFGKAGRKYVQRVYSWPATVSRFEDVFEQIFA